MYSLVSSFLFGSDCQTYYNYFNFRHLLVEVTRESDSPLLLVSSTHTSDSPRSTTRFEKCQGYASSLRTGPAYLILTQKDVEGLWNIYKCTRMNETHQNCNCLLIVLNTMKLAFLSLTTSLAFYGAHALAASPRADILHCSFGSYHLPCILKLL